MLKGIPDDALHRVGTSGSADLPVAARNLAALLTAILAEADRVITRLRAEQEEAQQG